MTVGSLVNSAKSPTGREITDEITPPSRRREPMNRPIEFLEDYCTFGEDQVYLEMAVARKKANPEIIHSSEIGSETL